MKVKLTKKQLDALQAWIDEAQPIMGLQGWKITAAAEPPGVDAEDDDAYAGTYVFDNADTARIHLGDAFWEETVDEQRTTLAHEMVHIIVNRRADFARDRMTRETDRATHRQLEEIAVENLARVIAPRLPLPKIPKP